MRVFAAPHRYFQARGALDRIGELFSGAARKFFVIADELVLSLFGERVVRSIDGKGGIPIVETFCGECSYPEIERLKMKAGDKGCEIVVALGGGKVADTAKMLSLRLKRPAVIVPTIASTDAPTSHLAVIYDEEHRKKEVVRMDFSPAAVVVDTEVIAAAPPRYLTAGIGDALSTWFEADACYKSGNLNALGGKPTRAALALARLCYDILLEQGVAALGAVRKKEVTPALEDVVEASILLSGLGFESGGLAAAHAIHGGFTLIREMDPSLHGEKVAYGVLVQLLLEGRELSFIQELMGFYKAVGLPATLAELGFATIDGAKLEKAVEFICCPGSYIYNLNSPVGPQAVLEAILSVNELGRSI
jgi:glycerol dehydrogenase